ncbi:MAG: exosortase system-associated protein, TIGR04073 family [Verrucomicrobia bacterium]|jgi:putative exosortase-associated protein (TIGR04073 family)|nr:exosortase system-associated protein, TIGR04073 family [Verrucomicrobiota bacterium]
MRNKFLLLVLMAASAAFVTGCANTEQKLGRGIGNMFEIVRGGEYRRTMEQTALFDGPDTAYTRGFVSGISRTIARTGVGVYEVVTCPFPSYEPVFTDYLSPEPVYPDNYKPTLMEDSMFATDGNLGFSGGDVAPIVPGSRFRIFDTH